MSTTIAHLANELLFAVFEYLDDADLHSLSFVSRSIHDAALQTMIVRLGGNSAMERNAHLLSSRSSLQLLRAVRTALFIQTLDHVLVSTEGEQTLMFMAGLARLFDRMTRVRSATIMIWGTEHMEGGAMLEMAQRTLSSLAGKDCEMLELNGWHISEKSSILPVPKERKTLASMRLGGPGGWRLAVTIKGPPRNKTPPPPAVPHNDSDNILPPLNTLTSLRLNDCDISVKCIRRWIIDSANQSCITSFHVTNRPGGHFHNAHIMHIARALPFITLPYLRTIWLSSSCVNVAELLLFLCRHPTITYLGLLTDDAELQSHCILQPTLPAVTGLAISPRLLGHILLTQQSLPNLKDVSLRSWGSDIWDSLWYTFMERAFARLARRESVRSLEVLFPPPEFTEPWLTRRRHSIERTMRFVTTVSIGACIFGTFGCEMELLFVKWLSLFPAVEHVKIDKSAFMLGHLDPTFSYRVALAIAKECPRIQTAEMGLQIFHLAQLNQEGNNTA